VANNHTLVFSSAGGNAISIADAAAAKGGNVQVTLTSTHGTLALATTSGLTFTAGANHSATMTIVAPLSNILAALNGLTFTPTARYTGGASIKMTAKDSLDGQSGSATIALTVTKAAPAAKPAAQGNSTSPPSAPVAGGAIAGSSVFAGGDYLTDETDYWKGLVAAIEALNRP
jgi:hypothetical protein